jgi:hypothetical protein
VTKKRGRSPEDDIPVNESKRGKNAQDTRKRKPSPNNNNKSNKTQKYQHNTYSASIDDKTHILNIKYDNKSVEINLVELYEKIKTNKKGIFPIQLVNPRMFFEYVFYTDALKDNCPINILKNIIKDVNGAILQKLLDSSIPISGNEIKTKAKSVIRKCLDNFSARASAKKASARASAKKASSRASAKGASAMDTVMDVITKGSKV